MYYEPLHQVHHQNFEKQVKKVDINETKLVPFRILGMSHLTNQDWPTTNNPSGTYVNVIISSRAVNWKGTVDHTKKQFTQVNRVGPNGDWKGHRSVR
jgi:hypothetical protein